MKLYTIKTLQLGSREYFAVFDNESDTSSRLFASFKDAFNALAKAQENEDEGVNARNI